MNIKTFIQRYPVASYFVLAFTISWVSSFAVGGGKFLRGEILQLEDGLTMALGVLAGPSLAGILMTYLSDGKDGLRDLLSRMLKWRVGLRWYAAALLTFPVLILAVLLGFAALVSPEFSPGFFSFGIIAGLMAGFVEEIGWTGFAYPKLQSRHGTLRASLFLALLHGLWHIVPSYLAESPTRGADWLPWFTIMWMVAMTAMRILLVWIYSNTGSVLLAQLTHASSTGFLVILGPKTISTAGETLWWGVYALVLWLAAAIVLRKYGSRLVEQPGGLQQRLSLGEGA